MDYNIFIKVFSGILRKRESLSFGGRFQSRREFSKSVTDFLSFATFFLSVRCVPQLKPFVKAVPLYTGIWGGGRVYLIL